MKAHYEIVPSSQPGFFAYKRTGHQFPFNWHFHPEYELTLIEEGYGQRFVGNHIGDYGPGDLVLLGPNLPHTWRSIRASKRSTGGHSALVVQFRVEHLGEDFLALGEMQPVNQLFARSRSGLHFGDAEAVRKVGRQLRQLLRLSGGRRTLSLLSVLLDLSVTPEASELSSGSVRPLCKIEEKRRMNKICLFLSRHSSEIVDYDALAQLVGMERASLCRFFKRASGRTMGEYVNEIRLSEAVRLLSGSERSLLDISQHVGFQNYANFCRQFKRSKGFSARTIRQQFRSFPVDLREKSEDDPV